MHPSESGRITCESIYGAQVTAPLSKFVFRPSVYAIVIEDGQILLVRHRRSGQYVFPGGGIEIGEQIEEALRRELLEEAGIQIEILSFLHFKEHFFYFDPQDQGYHSLMFFYKAQPVHRIKGDYKNRPKNDTEEALWIDLSDLKREDFYTPFHEVYDLLFKDGKNQY